MGSGCCEWALFLGKGLGRRPPQGLTRGHCNLIVFLICLNLPKAQVMLPTY